jgi:DMSO reductase family type II enzyme chaperone
VGPADLTAHEQEVLRGLERAAMYRLLGGALGYPLPQRLEAVADLARRVSSTGTGSAPELGPALERLAAAARQADAGALAGEYVFLFDRGVRCPPYEGAWGEAPQLAGKAALLADIAGFYAAFGLAPSGAQPDMEDHLAAELEFMSALALKEAWAVAEERPERVAVTRQAEVAFLSDHLGRWAEAFAAALREATPIPYYAAVADLLEAWVRAEVQAAGAAPARVTARLGYDPIQQEDTFTCPMAPEEPAPGHQEET